MRKRTTGPVRFSAEEDDIDDDDVNNEDFASQFDDSVEQDTE
jgi:hypothetical protein